MSGRRRRETRQHFAETEEATKLSEKNKNEFECWPTFTTEPDVDSTKVRAERFRTSR
jgi:hypothetical protein